MRNPGRVGSAKQTGAAVGAGLIIALLSLHRLRDVDFWWQWKLGKVITESGIPVDERFMITRQGVPTFSLSWGYCLVLYHLEQVAGIAGVVVVKALIVLATWGIVWRIALRGSGAVAAAWATLVGALIASQRFTVRPETVTYLLFAVVLIILDSAVRGRTRLMWLLPLVIAVWANVHSTFILGLGTIGIWWAAASARLAAARFEAREPDALDRWRVWVGAGALGLSAAASLVNPYTYHAWDVPYRRLLAVLPDAWMQVATVAAVAMAGMGFLAASQGAGKAGRLWRAMGQTGQSKFWKAMVVVGVGMAGAMLGMWAGLAPYQGINVERAAISELASPWGLPRVLRAVLLYQVVAPVSVVLAVMFRREHGAYRVMLLVAMVALSSRAVRGLELFALVATPMLAADLGRIMIVARRWWRWWDEEKWQSVTHSIAQAAATALVCVSAYLAHSIVTNRFAVHQGDNARFGIGVDERVIPRAAAELLCDIKQRPRLFNTDRVGSYLMARGLGVFIDSRAVGNILPEYLEVLDNPERFREAVSRYSINAAVIDLYDRALVRRFAADADWRLVQLNAQSVVFFRRRFGSAVATLNPRDGSDGLMADLRNDLPPVVHRARWWEVDEYPGARVALAGVLWEFGAAAPARVFLEEAMILDPSRFREWDLLGSLRDADGDLSGADAAYAQALVEAPKVEAGLLARAGSARLRLGHAQEALALAERGYAIDSSAVVTIELGVAAASAMQDRAASARWRQRLEATHERRDVP